MDWMAELGGFGENVFDSVSENVGGLVDGVLDYYTQKNAQTQANPQTQKAAEPVKGKTVEGQPIVVGQPVIGGFSATQIMMIAGGLGLLGVVLVASRG